MLIALTVMDDNYLSSELSEINYDLMILRIKKHGLVLFLNNMLVDDYPSRYICAFNFIFYNIKRIFNDDEIGINEILNDKLNRTILFQSLIKMIILYEEKCNCDGIMFQLNLSKYVKNLFIYIKQWITINNSLDYIYKELFSVFNVLFLNHFSSIKSENDKSFDKYCYFIHNIARLHKYKFILQPSNNQQIVFNKIFINNNILRNYAISPPILLKSLLSLFDAFYLSKHKKIDLNEIYKKLYIIINYVIDIGNKRYYDIISMFMINRLVKAYRSDITSGTNLDWSKFIFNILLYLIYKFEKSKQTSLFNGINPLYLVCAIEVNTLRNESKHAINGNYKIDRNFVEIMSTSLIGRSEFVETINNLYEINIYNNYELFAKKYFDTICYSDFNEQIYKFKLYWLCNINLNRVICEINLKCVKEIGRHLPIELWHLICSYLINDELLLNGVMCSNISILYMHE